MLNLLGYPSPNKEIKDDFADGFIDLTGKDYDLKLAVLADDVAVITVYETPHGESERKLAITLGASGGALWKPASYQESTFFLRRGSKYRLKLHYENNFHGTNKDHADVDGVSVFRYKIPPPLEIKRDEEGGAVTWDTISGKMANALPGQKINLMLDATSLPQGASVTDYHWSVTGGIFKDYTADKTKGIKTNVAQIDLDQEVLHFYWCEAGSQTITLNCKINWVVNTLKAQINVIEPVNVLSATITHVIRKGGLVKLAMPGIVFTASVDHPADKFGSEGEFQCVQLVNDGLHYTTIKEKQFVGNSYHQWVLDNSYPYLPSIATGNGKEFDDLPSAGPENDAKKQGTADQFIMYLMFKPPGSNTKWVPLKEMGWQWKFEAVITNFIWTLVPGSTGATVNSPGTPTHTHPEWKANWSPFQWVPQGN